MTTIVQSDPASGTPRVRRCVAVAVALAVSAGVATAVPATADPSSPAGNGVPSPTQLVERTGQWFSHGRTLELRDDGTGTFTAWIGAFDGTRIRLRLVPVDGVGEVAEVTAVEQIGLGALSPSETPGVGDLVTIGFGEPVPTAHVQWSAGPRRKRAGLCPVAGLNRHDMEALGCGA